MYVCIMIITRSNVVVEDYPIVEVSAGTVLEVEGPLLCSVCTAATMEIEDCFISVISMLHTRY